MAGYSGKALSQKLGIKPGFRIFADSAPKPYRKIVGESPDGVIWVSWPKKASGVATDLSDVVVRRKSQRTSSNSQLLDFHSAMVMMSGFWP